MQLETKRLLLREYKIEDFDALYEILSDADVMKYYPKPFDAERVKGWIEWNLDNYRKYGFGLWAVILKDSGKLIGDCGITIQNIDGEQLPEIGYHIHKDFWQKGFASEAASAVRDWAFSNTKYSYLYSYMKHTNIPSIKTAQKIGMKKLKEYPDEINGTTCVFRINQ
ncbi:MAG: GNAT family N-acetyltransferase [Spirochaetaceae bacterium]|nr:GNAT family N-acetyltransferase [Spirochaetaceae bacterium]